MVDDYRDIIDIPYIKSNKHKQMSIHDRAAQFMPFAALTGYDQMVKETARRTSSKKILDEEEKRNINEKLILLSNNIKDRPNAIITYFIADDKKSGGSYVTVSGSIKKIDIYNNIIVLVNKIKIPINNISDIELKNIDSL